MGTGTSQCCVWSYQCLKRSETWFSPTSELSMLLKSLPSYDVLQPPLSDWLCSQDIHTALKHAPLSV